MGNDKTENSVASHGHRERRRIFQNWTFWGTPRYDDKPLRDHLYRDRAKTEAFNDVTEFVEVLPGDPDIDELLNVVRALRDYIDAIPGDVEFEVAMPGVDRDWVDSVLGSSR